VNGCDAATSLVPQPVRFARLVGTDPSSIEGVGMPPESDNSRGLPAGWGIPTGVVTGAAIGMLIGILLEQLTLGLILGAAVGLLAGSVLTTALATPDTRRGGVTAVAIAVVTAGSVAVLLLLLR
jgi:hypothetical protein